MKRIHFHTLAAITVATTLFIACNTQTTAKQDDQELAEKTASMVSRGEYLVNSIGCDDCHSPKKMGPNGPEIIQERRFSGYPADRPIAKADTGTINKGWALFGPDLTSAAGPWGMSFSANISSDATGIGSWKEEQFMKAIREGKYKGLEGSRSLLPPMPWFVYKNLTDDDIKSIFAYLKSVPPVKNIVPAPIGPKDL